MVRMVSFLIQFTQKHDGGVLSLQLSRVRGTWSLAKYRLCIDTQTIFGQVAGPVYVCIRRLLCICWGSHGVENPRKILDSPLWL